MSQNHHQHDSHRDHGHQDHGCPARGGRPDEAHGRERTRVLGVLVGVALLAAGCGTVSLDTGSPDAGLVDTGVDAGQDVTIGVDSVEQPDQGGKPDVKTGVACKTETDCLVKMTGLTPCKLPKCEGGFCTEPLIQEEGKLCSAPNLSPTSCQMTACDAQGECAIKNVKDMTVCGTQVCGKFCEAGVCRDDKEGDYDDGNPCTQDYCNQGLEVVHKKIDDLGVSCDDGNACTEGDACIKGTCAGQLKSCDDAIACTHDVCVPDSGCVHTPQDSKCTGDDPCVNLACSVTDGCAPALDKPFNPGADCDDGDSCTPEDKEKCNDKGQCVSPVSTCDCASDEDCLKEGKQIDACKPKICNTKTKKCVQDLANFVDCSDAAKNDGFCVKTKCDPTSGQCVKELPNEGKSCDDNSVCTSASACKEGVCAGEPDKKCDDGNPCTADSCDPAAGCKYDATEGSCDDGNPCTNDDACSGGSCKGVEIGCNDGVDCTFDTCDSKTGQCVQTPKAALCNDDESCTTDTCDKTKGCKHSPKPGTPCEDDDICTVTTCGKTGACDNITGYKEELPGCGCQKDAECASPNACKVGKCVKGECTFSPVPKGKVCDTGNKCHVPGSGVCDGGACTGGKPKNCSKAGDGKCMVGQCELGSGTCVAKPKADGQACDADGSKCTPKDTCKAGKCLVGKAVDCSALTKGCTVGVCDKASGKCAGKPAADKTPCDDGNFCTVLEKCVGGKCGGGSMKTCSEESDACNKGSCDSKLGKCKKIPKPSTTVCDDGKYCTVSDTCDGKGNCGTGKPRKCPGGECRVPVCNESKNTCEKKLAAAGSACNDGDKCTQTDKCGKKGKCVGSNPKDCSAGTTQCGTGFCTTSTGACSVKPKPSGTACDDGDACTVGDECVAAICTKGKPKVCNDGNACTVGDKCVKGSCVPGAPKVCPSKTCQTVACDAKTGACKYTPVVGCGGNCVKNSDCKSDGNVCTTDSCVSGKCKYAYNTLGCEDGNKCTLSDKCSNGVCKSGSAKPCTAKTCYTVSCNKSTGACDYAPLPLGAPCSDGSPCTIFDKCYLGKCAGAPVKCNDGNPCTTDSCVGGKCVYLNNILPCEDGNKCTLSDKCYLGKCKSGKAVVCKQDGTKCTQHICKKSTGSCVAVATYDGYACEYGGYSACYNKACYCKVGEAKIGTKYSDVFNAITGDGYGGSIAVGYTYGAGYDGYIVRFDRSRKVRWKVSVSATSQNEYLYAVVRLKKKSTFVAIGTRYAGSTVGYTGWLVEFDINGKILRKMDIKLGSKDDRLLDAVVDEYGTVWAVGYTYSFGTYSRGWLVRLDSTATKIMVNTTYTLNTTKHYRFDGVAYDSSYNRVTVVGRTTNGKYGGYDGLVVQYANITATSYKYQWYGLYGGSGSDYLRKVRVIGSYLIAVGHSYSNTKGGSDGWYLRLSRTSSTMYTDKRYGGTGSDGFVGLSAYGSYPVIAGYKFDGKYTRGSFTYLSYTGTLIKQVLSPSNSALLYGVTYLGSSVFANVGQANGDALLMQTTTSGTLSCSSGK